MKSSNDASTDFKIVSLQYIVAIFLSLILFTIITHAWNANLEIPFFYSWDSIFSGEFIKSIIDTGWIIKNPNIGAPAGLNYSDYPIFADNFHFLIIKILSLFTNKYGIIFNIFYILTFPTITITALFSLKKLSLRYPFALTASLLFTMLPYHFSRASEGHIFLASYFIVPLIIWVCYLINANKFYFLPKCYRKYQWLLYLILCILIGTTGVYYAVFGIFFILTTGLIRSLQDKKSTSIIKSIILTGIITLTLLINIWPSIIYKKNYGPNPSVPSRVASETEFYGLKITQLLLPVKNDRIRMMANFRNKYDNSSPLINENSFSTLGLIGSIGFITLIFILITGIRTSSEITLLSRLNLSAVLLATTGGFGSYFSYTVTPIIRCYNRISIFIAFFSLFTFFYFAQRFIAKYSNSKLKTWLIMGTILTLGIFTQTGYTAKNLQSNDTISYFNNDKKFITTIEKTMYPGSMIYQLPYVPFPENPKIYNMSDYAQLRPYLHSHHLKWSYGSMKGRAMSQWQDNTSRLSTKKMINNLIYLGYTGIYINRNGYEDHGMEIENNISRITHTKPLESPNKNMIFFDIINYSKKLKINETKQLWNHHIKLENIKSKVYFSWGDGFYPLEHGNSEQWRWSKKNSSINIANQSNKKIKIKVKFKIFTGNLEKASIRILGPSLDRNIRANSTGKNIEMILTIFPGTNKFKFITDTKQIYAPHDPRMMFFQIKEFSYSFIT